MIIHDTPVLNPVKSSHALPSAHHDTPAMDKTFDDLILEESGEQANKQWQQGQPLDIETTNELEHFADEISLLNQLTEVSISNKEQALANRDLFNLVSDDLVEMLNDIEPLSVSFHFIHHDTERLNSMTQVVVDDLIKAENVFRYFATHQNPFSTKKSTSIAVEQSKSHSLPSLTQKSAQISQPDAETKVIRLAANHNTSQQALTQLQPSFIVEPHELTSEGIDDESLLQYAKLVSGEWKEQTRKIMLFQDADKYRIYVRDYSMNDKQLIEEIESCFYDLESIKKLYVNGKLYKGEES